MSFKILSLFFGVFLLAPYVGFAQNLEKITKLELEYWRSFDGVIKIEIFVPFEAKNSELVLSATITAGKKDGGGETHIGKRIKEEDLQTVLKYFNSEKVRQSFAKSEPVLQPDGSHLSVTATQNSLSLTFSSQHAFSRVPYLAVEQQENATELGRVAQELLKLAGIEIPKERLY